MIDMNNLLSAILFHRICSGPDFMSFHVFALACLLLFYHTIIPYSINGNEARKGCLHSLSNFYTNT